MVPGRPARHVRADDHLASCGIPQLAAAEIRRCAEHGARALSFPENPVPLGLPSYWTDHWDPVWQACQDHDVVLCLHIGTSGEIPRPDARRRRTCCRSRCSRSARCMSSVNLMMSPVCRKFPGLKFVFSEGGIGWLPNALERADRMWLRHKVYSDLDDILPSEIYRQNMYLCMIEEPVCLKYRDDIGVDHIMWECDYPHTDTTWPDSQATTQEVFEAAGVTDEEADAHHPRQRRAGLPLDDGGSAPAFAPASVHMERYASSDCRRGRHDAAADPVKGGCR